MKSTLRHYGPVALLLALILVVSTVLGLWVGGDESDAEHRVMVTTYPLYVATQSILGDNGMVELTLFSGAGTGCLHDYQLTPADRLALERADLVITNGIGEEPFLEGIAPDRVVNTGAGIEELLCADHHHEGEHHHEETYNEHVWVSPKRYSRQVLAVLNTLIALVPANEALYRNNAENYLRHVDYVWSDMATAPLTDRPCVLFHDSLSYLAEDLGLDVLLTLTFDGDSGISAEDLAAVERLAREHPDLLLIYDTQYPVRYGTIDGLVPADQVLALETAVVGNGSSADWVDAMTRNAQKLKQLTGGDAP